jgi:hypothetical protein
MMHALRSLVSTTWHLASGCLLFLVSTGPLAWGQAVQLPVVEQFSLETTVVVPDRGRTFLGGVSRSAEGRQSFGPFRSGTNIGFSRSATHAEARVWIHDPELMDELLLNTVESKLPPLTADQRRETAREILRRRSRR